MKDNRKHNEKTPARQEADGLRRFAPGGDHAGKAGFRATGGGDAHRPATDARDASLPIRVGDGAGALCGIFAAESSAFSGTRADVDWDSESAASADDAAACMANTHWEVSKV